MDIDTNNVAPRAGFAWRIKPGTILRGGYGVSYNSGTYSTIARQLVAQPPFATTNTSIGTFDRAALLHRSVHPASPDETTNTFGIDQGMGWASSRPGMRICRSDFRQAWNVGAGYTETRGSSLDMVRAPNRDPDGSAHRRRPGVPVGDIGRIVDPARRFVPPAPAAGQGHRLRRVVHACEVP